MSAGTVCRAAAGACDIEEQCNGSSAACPADVLVASATVCRNADGTCDPAEACSGVSASCPADAVASPGTPCGDPGDAACDRPDSCDAAGACLDNLEPNGTTCSEASICGVEQCLEGACAPETLDGCLILPFESEASAGFGTSVALDEALLVVGAPGAGGSGRAHVFERVNGAYVEQSQATPVALPLSDPDGSEGAIRFGTSVDVDGATIVVGAPDDVVDTGEGSSSGSASVFVWNGAAWELQAKLVDESGLCAGLGGDVAVSGDTIALGAPEGDCVLVFVRNAGSWSLEEDLHGSEAGRRFGHGVAVSGGTLLVGEPGATSGGDCSGAGAVHAFVHTQSAWIPEDTVDEPGQSGGACFGEDVALDGELAVGGAPRDDTTAVDAGAAYVLVHSGSQWQIAAPLLAEPAGSAGDLFGASVAIFGDDVLVGAPGAAAYLFQPLSVGLTRAAGTWSVDRRYLPPAGEAGEDNHFGASVAVVSGKVTVGAPEQAVDEVTGAGAAYSGSGIDVPPEVCGDGTTTSGEECDDGDTLWEQGQACNGACAAVECGDANDSGTFTASDALFALRAGVGAVVCDLSVCDAGGNGSVAASDALLILRKAVGGPVDLNCL